ncbi:MAG: hypothetical protein V1489_01335 [Candidatus Liptonbacteria bacterium]
MTLLFKNAHIVDASGLEPFRGDIIVRKNTISAIGDLAHTKADRVIDCQGAYVAPGLIDMHTIADEQLNILEHPDQNDAIASGITSAIGGNNGFSLAPYHHKLLGHLFLDKHSGHRININWTSFKEFLNSVKSIKFGINFGSLVGYETAKYFAGSNEGAIKIIEQSLKEGALGVSLPQKQISAHEFQNICDALDKHPAVLSLPRPPESKKEFARLQTLSKAGVQVLLYDTFPPFADKAQHEFAEKNIEAWSDDGFWFVVPPSKNGLFNIRTLLPGWLRNESTETILEKLSDSWLSKRICSEIKAEHLGPARIVHAPEQSPLIGLSLENYMKHRGIRSREEAIIHLLHTTGIRVVLALENPSWKYIEKLHSRENTMFGSFAIGTYRTHWRGFDFTPGFLELLFDTEAQGANALAGLFKKASATPARLLELPKRGTLREGMSANLIVFKNKTLKMTVVNGMVAYEDGQFAPERYGGPLVRSIIPQ